MNFNYSYGMLQSVMSAGKTNALEASFVYSPVGEAVDWRLSAIIAPCHVTVIDDFPH